MEQGIYTVVYNDNNRTYYVVDVNLLDDFESWIASDEEIPPYYAYEIAYPNVAMFREFEVADPFPVQEEEE